MKWCKKLCSTKCASLNNNCDAHGTLKTAKVCERAITIDPIVAGNSTQKQTNYSKNITAQQLSAVTVTRSCAVLAMDRQFVDPEEFFCDPDEVTDYQNKKLVAEWIVVEKNNLDDITTCLYENGQHSLAIVKGTALVTSYDKESFANSLMGPLLEPTEVLQISHRSAKKLIKQKEHLCLEKHFGLNDAGQVLIHLDHIVVHDAYVEVTTKLEYTDRVCKATEIGENYKVRVTFEAALLKFFRRIFRKKGKNKKTTTYFLSRFATH